MNTNYQTRVVKSAQKFFASIGKEQTRIVRSRLLTGTANSGHFRSGFGVATRRSVYDMTRTTGERRRSLVETVAERHLDTRTVKTNLVRSLLIQAANASLKQ